MCKAMEELRVESRKEMAVEMAQSLYEQGVSIEQIAKAVSYTHLTLPTIYSV